MSGTAGRPVRLSWTLRTRGNRLGSNFDFPFCTRPAPSRRLEWRRQRRDVTDRASTSCSCVSNNRPASLNATVTPVVAIVPRMRTPPLHEETTSCGAAHGTAAETLVHHPERLTMLDETCIQHPGNGGLVVRIDQAFFGKLPQDHSLARGTAVPQPFVEVPRAAPDLLEDVLGAQCGTWRQTMDQVLGDRKQFGRDFTLGEDQLSHIGLQTGSAVIQVFRERDQARDRLSPRCSRRNCSSTRAHLRRSGRRLSSSEIDRIPDRSTRSSPMPYRQFQTCEHGCRKAGSSRRCSR